MLAEPVRRALKRVCSYGPFERVDRLRERWIIAQHLALMPEGTRVVEVRVSAYDEGGYFTDMGYAKAHPMRVEQEISALEDRHEGIGGLTLTPFNPPPVQGDDITDIVLA